MHRRLLAAALLISLAACGGSDGGPPPPSGPTTAPSATITATGAGAVVLHPSLSSAYGFALETPLRITETGGGEADWNFARFSVYLGGREIERGEIGSDIIRNAGYGRIKPKSNETYTVVFRFNSVDFDDLRITLGFADINTARQFTVDLPDNAFPDVNISLTPLNVPADTVIRLPR
jgi:hypothetical protein